MNRKWIDEAAESVLSRTEMRPGIAMVLGSGLGELAEQVELATIVPYGEIPHFKSSTVHGHKGNLVLGRLAGKNVVAMQGRLHYYEGYSMFDITFPLRVMNALGATTLIVTNAAGGINPEWKVGELMLITDHINWSGMNPLHGVPEEFGPRFVDMSFSYDKELQSLARRVAREQGMVLREGVYAFGSGPSYETPSEIRMLRTIGADAAGMSTVPEVVIARQLGMRVLGVSCITNMAAGILPQPLSHEEVIETTERVKESFKNLILTLLGQIE